MSGRAGTWHPGHALYCLCRWARRRWQHTKESSATWRFDLDGWKQAEIIPTLAGRPATDNLFPVFVIHPIRPLGAGQSSAAIHTGEEARAAHTALASEIFAALRTTLVRHLSNPAMP